MTPAYLTRISVSAIFLCLMFGVSRDALAAPPAKKLIEYGWDVPTPAQMETNLETIEKRPFDGIIFQFAGGYNAFSTNLLDPAKFAEDTRILHHLKFTRFTENFAVIWGSPPPGFDWFDDTQWMNIVANAKLLAGVAQAGHVKGICFDPEPYDFRLWHYSEQPRAATHTFAEYRAKVRERGAQLMRAFESRMPGPTILSFFHVSMFDKWATLPETEQAEKLEKDKWGLMPDFFIGMLEAASPGTRFIDGNENSYYYTTSEQYFRAYQAIHQRATGLLPSDLREKYRRQVEAGQALYVDHDFALRQPNTGKYLSYRMDSEDQAKWFEHNTYWALYSTDEYVWLYSERMSWWKNQTPPGLEEAVLSARQKITDSQPLGFDIAPIIQKAENAGKK